MNRLSSSLLAATPQASIVGIVVKWLTLIKRQMKNRIVSRNLYKASLKLRSDSYRWFVSKLFDLFGLVLYSASANHLCKLIKIEDYHSKN